MRFTLLIDPALLSTAQQRITSFKFHRIITNPRVAAGMKLVETAAKPYARQAAEIQRNSPFGAVALSVAFYFRFPKSGTKAEKRARLGGQPVTSARYGDIDNRAKAFCDALVNARLFPDDRLITTLLLRKRYTLAQPRIEVEVLPDISWQLGREILPMDEENADEDNSAPRPLE